MQKSVVLVVALVVVVSGWSSGAGATPVEWTVASGGNAHWYDFVGYRFMRPNVMKQPVDEEAVDKIINKNLPPILEYLESQVPAEGFIFGDLTVADLALASPFVNAGYAQYTIDAAKWPKFSALVERVKAHSAMAPLLKAEAAMFGGSN